MSAIAPFCQGELLGHDAEFTRVSTDTRTIREGDLFVALVGESFDGHDYLDIAHDRGAVGAVVSHHCDTGKIPLLRVEDTCLALGRIAQACRKAFKGKVVGVTGSSGKTTVKGMLHSICGLAGTSVATQGNFNNHIGVPLSLLQLGGEQDYAVIEAGASNIGEIRYLTELIQPNVALVNNIMPAHVEGFGSVDAIASEKAEIYGRLTESDTAIVNLDDAYRSLLMDRIPSGKIIGFGEKSNLFMHGPVLTVQEKEKFDEIILGEEIDLDEFGRLSFSLTIGVDADDVSLNVFGGHQLHNALAAAACAKGLGIPIDTIKRGLEEYTGEPGRMQVCKIRRGKMLINDSYNANPGSMKAAIDFLQRFDDSILVCGDMAELGDEAESAHKQIGRYAHEQGVSRLMATGELSKNTVEGFGVGAEYFENRDVLVTALQKNLSDKSVVLVKGSRCAHMEDVVNALSQKEETA